MTDLFSLFSFSYFCFACRQLLVSPWLELLFSALIHHHGPPVDEIIHLRQGMDCRQLELQLSRWAWPRRVHHWPLVEGVFYLRLCVLPHRLRYQVCSLDTCVLVFCREYTPTRFGIWRRNVREGDIFYRSHSGPPTVTYLGLRGI